MLDDFKSRNLVLAPDTPARTFVALWCEETQVGAGAEAVADSVLTVNYEGRLADGTEFGSSRNKPFSFMLGRRQVIAGWEAGFYGMRAGGRRRLLIPWQLGYGTTPVGIIPACSDLIFEVELLAVTELPRNSVANEVQEPFQRMRSALRTVAQKFPILMQDWRPSEGAESLREIVRGTTVRVNTLVDAMRAEDVNPRSPVPGGTDVDVWESLEICMSTVEALMQATRIGLLNSNCTIQGELTTQRGVFVAIDVELAECLGAIRERLHCLPISGDAQ
jgi:hypothetical protein